MVPDAAEKVQAETNDPELLRIAQELNLIQFTRRLQGLEPFSATINSGRRNYAVSSIIHVDEDDPQQFFADWEQKIDALFQDFADWIYEQLKNEYEYLTSDEYVDERLAEEMFDEDCAVV